MLPAVLLFSKAVAAFQDPLPDQLQVKLKESYQSGLASDWRKIQDTQRFVERASDHNFSYVGEPPKHWFTSPALGDGAIRDITGLSEEEWILDSSLSPAESEVWAESVLDNTLTRLYGIDEESLWPFLDKGWEVNTTIRVCDGMLYSSLMQALYNMTHTNLLTSLDLIDYDIDRSGSTDVTYGRPLAECKSPAVVAAVVAKRKQKPTKRKKRKETTSTCFDWKQADIRKYQCRSYFLSECARGRSQDGGLSVGSGDGVTLYLPDSSRKQFRLNRVRETFLKQRVPAARKFKLDEAPKREKQDAASGNGANSTGNGHKVDTGSRCASAPSTKTAAGFSSRLKRAIAVGVSGGASNKNEGSSILTSGSMLEVSTGTEQSQQRSTSGLSSYGKPEEAKLRCMDAVESCPLHFTTTRTSEILNRSDKGSCITQATTYEDLSAPSTCCCVIGESSCLPMTEFIRQRDDNRHASHLPRIDMRARKPRTMPNIVTLKATSRVSASVHDEPGSPVTSNIASRNSATQYGSSRAVTTEQSGRIQPHSQPSTCKNTDQRGIESKTLSTTQGQTIPTATITPINVVNIRTPNKLGQQSPSPLQADLTKESVQARASGSDRRVVSSLVLPGRSTPDGPRHHCDRCVPPKGYRVSLNAQKGSDTSFCSVIEDEVHILQLPENIKRFYRHNQSHNGSTSNVDQLLLGTFYELRQQYAKVTAQCCRKAMHQYGLLNPAATKNDQKEIVHGSAYNNQRDRSRSSNHSSESHLLHSKGSHVLSTWSQKQQLSPPAPNKNKPVTQTSSTRKAINTTHSHSLHEHCKQNQVDPSLQLHTTASQSAACTNKDQTALPPCGHHQMLHQTSEELCPHILTSAPNWLCCAEQDRCCCHCCVCEPLSHDSNSCDMLSDGLTDVHSLLASVWNKPHSTCKLAPQTGCKQKPEQTLQLPALRLVKSMTRGDSIKGKESISLCKTKPIASLTESPAVFSSRLHKSDLQARLVKALRSYQVLHESVVSSRGLMITCITFKKLRRDKKS